MSVNAARGSERSGSRLKASVSRLGSASLALNAAPEVASVVGLPELTGMGLEGSAGSCNHTRRDANCGVDCD